MSPERLAALALVVAGLVACGDDGGDAAAAPAGDGSSEEALPLGAPCEADAACDSGVCVGWCSERCASHDECGGEAPRLHRCLPDAEGVRWCFPGCTSDDDCAGLTSSDGAPITCVGTGDGDVCTP